jgi:hypothetical protein
VLAVRVAIATEARVVIPGVPDNWSQWRGSSIARDAKKAIWRRTAWLIAQSARNAAGWPLPVKCDPPARRFLAVAVFKHGRLYDEDGCVSALKPLIDGACGRQAGAPSGVLAFDDSPAWLGLITAPIDMQRVATTGAEERVVLTVHLVDPRTAAPS